MVRRNMGLTGQVATVDELLTGRENIRMIGGLYGIARRDLNRSMINCWNNSRSPTPPTGRCVPTPVG